MEWEAVERRSENERLSAALAKLIDRNWSQDKKLDQALDRVRDLESRVEGTESLLKESHINQTALDVEVVGLQQRVEELESEMKWTRGITDQHSSSFDDFGAQVEELEAHVDRQEGTNTYNEHLHRGLSGRINWLFRREESLNTRMSDLEDEVQLESHCCHCPASEPGVERGPSGWEPRAEPIRWPTRADVDREIAEDEEMVDMRVRLREIESESEPLEEEAYELASPATAPSVSLRPVSPSVVSESEETGVSTRETTPGPDENVVPLPVVRGVVRSIGRVRPGPYAVTASSRRFHVNPTIIRHYLSSVIGGRSDRGVVQIGNAPYGSVYG